MSEVQSRPSAQRGRGGSSRGGRGGFSRGRGGRSHTTNGDKLDVAAPSIEEAGEVGQLKKKYGSKVATIKEMFPDWTDEDVVFALQETDGDLETTVDRITDGMFLCYNVLRWDAGTEYALKHVGTQTLCSHALQAQLRNGEKFRRSRKIVLDLRLRTQLPPRERLGIPEEPHVVAELALMGEVAVVEDLGEAVDPLSHTSMAGPRKTRTHRYLLLSRVHGIQLLLLTIRQLGTL
jgi:hypothetical protein